MELLFLFEFQSVIMEMQMKIVEARGKGATEETLKLSIERIDRLIKVYKNFDKYYFNAHFQKERNQKLEGHIMSLSEQIDALKAENHKLLESLNWK